MSGRHPWPPPSKKLWSDCGCWGCRVAIPTLTEKVVEKNAEIEDLRGDVHRAEELLETLAENNDWGPGYIRGAIDAYFQPQPECKADFYQGDPGDESDHERNEQ